MYLPTHAPPPEKRVQSSKPACKSPPTHPSSDNHKCVHCHESGLLTFALENTLSGGTDILGTSMPLIYLPFGDICFCQFSTSPWDQCWWVDIQYVSCFHIVEHIPPCSAALICVQPSPEVIASLLMLVLHLWWKCEPNQLADTTTRFICWILNPSLMGNYSKCTVELWTQHIQEGVGWSIGLFMPIPCPLLQ